MPIKLSIKTITIKKVIRLGMSFFIVMLIMIAMNFQSLIHEAMIDKGKTLARSVESALTSHMLTGTYEDKNNIIKQAASLHGIKNLTIIRNNSINQQFNLPNNIAINDPIIKQSFNSGKAIFEYPNLILNAPYLRLAFPYLAIKNQDINCMLCHNTKEGEVLAVLNFDVDMTNYLGMSLTYLYILFISFILGIIGISIVLIKIIDKNVKEPLENLIEETHHSYKKHIDIDTNRYESLELDNVASKINQFNHAVLKKNDELRELNEEIEATQSEIIHAMGYIGEARSKETANHVIRVSEISYLLAFKYGLPENECNWIKDASPMHDIGKVGIPDDILHKAGKLTDKEFKQIQQHPTWGYNVFKNSKRIMLKASSIIAHQHHERWDGNGYPQGLQGEDIHIYGRIVAVADVFDALSCKRCYKDAWTQERVYQYFIDNSGTQFDPAIVNVLIKGYDEVLAIIKQFNGECKSNCVNAH